MTRCPLVVVAASVVFAGCHPRSAAPQPDDAVTESRSVSDSATPPPRSSPADAFDPGGLSHEALLRLYYNDAGAGADEATLDTPEGALPPDTAFEGMHPTPVARAEYTISLPDERVTVASERAFHVDDQGDRASLSLVGTGLPLVPGTRVSSRAGFAGFALLAPDGRRYRVASPDELQTWFTGVAPRAGSTVAFRRSDDTVIASRAGLSLAIATEHQGAPHPLLCRTLVALFLGGDAAAARVGCADARMPIRATLRARGWPALVVERTRNATVELPRASLAVPPAEATADLAFPTRAPQGAFFAPSELRALPGEHAPDSALTLTNTLSREALVFVDDLAIGWLAAGATGTFVGLGTGRHLVRGRSFDGMERSRTATVTLPGSARLEIAPGLQ